MGQFPVIVDVNNNIIPRKIEENFSLGIDYALTTLTIDTGVITAGHYNNYLVAVETGATDDLATISGGTKGQKLLLMAADDAETVVVKHGTGNIYLSGAADFSLDSDKDYIELFYTGSLWVGAGVSVA